jgi:hypothetical protein
MPSALPQGVDFTRGGDFTGAFMVLDKLSDLLKHLECETGDGLPA